jgi:hypothetical protein
MRLLAVLLMTLPLCVACAPKGPLERAGAAVDEALDDARNGGETLENEIDDAVDEVRDGLDELNDN